METIKLQYKLQEMKTPEYFLDEFARSYGYNSFRNYVTCQHHTRNGREKIEELVNEAMIAFAAYCCDRQRESDAEAAETKTVNPGYMEMDVVDKSSILNNKLITDEL